LGLETDPQGVAQGLGARLQGVEIDTEWISGILNISFDLMG
jgi:hypothetical protein